MKKSIIAIPIILTACTSVQVKPVDASLPIKYVCIENNPKVEVQDFIPVVRDGFDRHGIATEVYFTNKPDKCEYTLTYTAYRKWDFSPYLSHAELRLEKDGHQVGYAEYHLNGGGGLSLTKWASTKDKMDPVIDELLKK